MSNLIPFDGNGKLPAYLANRTTRATSINKDVVGSGPSFPVLSIKGKVFTLVKGTEKRVLTRDDDPDEALQSVNLTVVRANTKSRVYYAKAYQEGESDGAKPTCFSTDGVAPDAAASEPQAKKCQACPQNVWGVKDGKGTACSQNTRLAVIDAAAMSEPYLLRVPPASRKAFADAVRMAEVRGLDYNMVVLKIAFDKEAPSPKLTFKPIGLLDDSSYAAVQAMYEDDVVREIVGIHVPPAEEAQASSDDDMSDLDAAIAARNGKPKPSAPAAAPVAEDELLEAAMEEAPKVAAKKAAAPKAAPKAEDDDNLLGDLDALLSSTDD